MTRTRSERVALVRKGRIDKGWFAVILLCLPALAGGVQPQQVLAPLPTTLVTPPAVEEVETNSAGFIDFGDAVPRGPQNEQPFQVRPLDLHPHLSYQLLVANGVQTAPGQPRSTLTQNVAPGLLVGFGRNWALDYTPTWTFYSNNQFHDTLDHAVTLNGGLTHGDWILGFTQTYNRSDTPLIETGGQTLQQTYVTGLTASYRFNTVMSMDLSANQNFTYSDTLINTREWSTLDWLNYQFWPRLDGGLGVGGGYDNVSVGRDSVFEQYQARVNWRATDVISFQVHGGLEDRQYPYSNTSDLLNPIFGAEIKYKPFEVTALVLDADRTVSSSPFVDQIIESTDVTASLNQRLLKKLYLSVGGGYHWTSYVSTSSTVSTGRRDHYYSVNASLTHVFLRRGTVAATYQYSDDSSTDSNFSFRSSQFGFQLGYQY